MPRASDAAARAHALAEELAPRRRARSPVETDPRQVHAAAAVHHQHAPADRVQPAGFSSQAHDGRSRSSSTRASRSAPRAASASSPTCAPTRRAWRARRSPRCATWLGAAARAPTTCPRRRASLQEQEVGAQDAHEAIRPTEVARTPESVRPFLTDEQSKLYDLIWKRAVASQTASGRVPRDHASTSRPAGSAARHRVGAQVRRLPEALRASTRRTSGGVAASRGRAGLRSRVAAEALVPASDGARSAGPARAALHAAAAALHRGARWSRRSKRRTSAGPSTYATIVATITARDYVEPRRRAARARPTWAMAVNQLLVATFPDIFQVDFTARMEEELDEIEEGKQRVAARWSRTSGTPFSQDLERAEKSSDEASQERVEETDRHRLPAVRHRCW